MELWKQGSGLIPAASESISLLSIPDCRKKFLATPSISIEMIARFGRKKEEVPTDPFALGQNMGSRSIKFSLMISTSIFFI